MKNQDEVVEAIIKTVSQRPDEPWLVVRHLDADDLEKALRRQLPTMRDNLHFLHWGVHDATSAYANVPNVILVGTQFLRGSQYEALTQLVIGSSEDIDPALVREVAAGDHRHLILQALCRGSVRRCENGGCPKVNAFVIGSSRYGFEAVLKEVFPSARIVPWRPVLKPLKGKLAMR
jgi:hypothetical protein